MRHDLIAKAQIQKYVIDKILINVSTIVSRSQLESLTLEQQVDFVTGSLIYHLRLYLAGSEHESNKVVKIPKTWWDAVKQRFLSKYKLTWKWAQVNNRVIKVQTRITKICPHLEVNTKNPMKHIEFLYNKEYV